MSPLEEQQGFTLIEVVLTMVLLTVGLMSLGPVMLAVTQGNRFAQDITLATSLAEDRLEEITNALVFERITEANFPDEPRGSVGAGDPRYLNFEREVVITDSLNGLGQSVLKSVTVTVKWRSRGNIERSVTLHGRQSRF